MDGFNLPCQGLPTTAVPFLLLVAMAAMRCPYRIYFHLYCVGIQEFAILGVNGSAYARFVEQGRASNESNAGTCASVWRKAGAQKPTFSSYCSLWASECRSKAGTWRGRVAGVCCPCDAIVLVLPAPRLSFARAHVHCR